MKFRIIFRTAALAVAFTMLVGKAQAQIDTLGERVSSLETSVAKLSRLKISGYVQPQWVWNNIDSLGNQFNTRSYFTIRRGRVKFTYAMPIEGTTGSIGATIYPDITENGVVLKEVYATWNIFGNSITKAPELAFQMGAMNRPFGYEIGHSSSAREVVERSTAQNRLFNGERDLGLQVMYAPVFGDLKPTLELGIFNGSDNFGKGPSVDFGSDNKLFFGTGAIIGTEKKITGSGPDSLYIASKINSADSTQFVKYTTANGIRQDLKEFIGRLHFPFLISDDFSFDVGGSWSLGGITPPSDIVAEYSGPMGAIELKKDGTGPHGFNTTGWEPSGLFNTNRTIIGGDLQLHLSVLPIGKTIIKLEAYTGTQPFYGTSALYSSADTVALGAPTGVLVKKSVMGGYAMLVQNITKMFQLAIRYDVWDPNTKFKGSDAANIPKINNASYIKTTADLGGDLSLGTLTIGVNAFVGGSLKFMFDYEMPKLEEFTKKVGTEIITQGDPKDDRFTFRMQFKF